MRNFYIHKIHTYITPIMHVKAKKKTVSTSIDFNELFYSFLSLTDTFLRYARILDHSAEQWTGYKHHNSVDFRG